MEDNKIWEQDHMDKKKIEQDKDINHRHKHTKNKKCPSKIMTLCVQ